MRFYVLMANLTPGVTILDVQNLLTAYGLNYYRIAPNVWIVVTYLDANRLAPALAHLTTPGGSLFLTRMDPSDQQGMMVPDFWTWVRNNGGGP